MPRGGGRVTNSKRLDRLFPQQDFTWYNKYLLRLSAACLGALLVSGGLIRFANQLSAGVEAGGRGDPGVSLGVLTVAKAANEVGGFYLKVTTAFVLATGYLLIGLWVSATGECLSEPCRLTSRTTSSRLLRGYVCLKTLHLQLRRAPKTLRRSWRRSPPWPISAVSKQTQLQRQSNGPPRGAGEQASLSL